MDIGLNHHRHLAGFAGGNFRQHLLNGSACPCGCLFFTQDPLTIVNDFPRPSFAIADHKIITGNRCAAQTQHFHREAWAGLLAILAAIVNQRTDLAPFGAGDKNVTNVQGTALD